MKVDEKINKIFERLNMGKDSSDINKKSKMVGTPLIFPKIDK